MIPDTVNVIRAEHVGEYCLLIEFDDGSRQRVDFKPFLMAAQHPEVRAYLDVVKFADFRIDFGELVWGDYALCFPIDELYLNRIVPNVDSKVAA